MARQDLLIRRRKFAAVAIAVLAVAGFSAKPAYRAFREYRTRQNLEAAKVAANHEDWTAARDIAHSVLLVRRDNFEAYRIWTRALGKLGAPSTYLAVAQLFADPRSTREDLLDALVVMARQAPHAVTMSAYACLLPELRDQAAFRAALIPLLIQRGQFDIAEQCVREVAQPGDPPLVRLELLRVLCSRPNVARLAESRRMLAELIVAKADEQALEALRILGETPEGLVPDPVLPDLPEWLAKQPKATARHHLCGMNPTLAAKPETADQGYDAAIKRFLASDPAALGSWLILHGKADRAAAILMEPAQTRSDAYLTRLNALLQLRRNDEITAALAAPPDSCDLVEKEIVQANFAASQSDMTGSEAAWTRAMNHAATDTGRNRFIEIARAATVVGAKEAAENAWVAAIRLGWGTLPLYNDLLPVVSSLIAKGRSEDLLAMFRTLLRFEPLNPDLRNNAYYFGLLHGLLTPDQVAAAMGKLIERHDKPVYQSTLMLAEMLDGRPTAALTRVAKFADDPGVTPMMIKALDGTARVLAGETEAGTVMLKEVDWRAFMHQERVVFRSMLEKLGISGLPMPGLMMSAAEDQPDQIPAWRKEVERLEKNRSGDLPPSLAVPPLPGTDVSDPSLPEP